MAEIITMPKLSDTMTEGVLAKWHKNIGDKVSAGDLLAEIETDKATMDFESFSEGILLYRGVEEGEAAKVDSILAILGEKGEDISALLAHGSNQSEVPKAAAQEEPTQAETKSESAQPKEAAQTITSGDRIKISPLAKKIAQEKGIDIANITGSGDGGRIIKRDVETFTPTLIKATELKTTSNHTYTDIKVSQMRKTIARRLAESKFTAPHFYLTISVDMSNAIEARTAINNIAENHVSFNDFIIKASALALKKHPTINSSWMGDFIRKYDYVNIGVAVAVDEGLLVPVVRNADLLSLSQISEKVRSYASKAKDKKLQPTDMEGNTFTISNLGMFGIEEFTAIINPPDACILAVGAINDAPVVKNATVVPGKIMKLTLSCDHRVVDGATGAAFLNTLKQYLENPITMLA